MKKYAIVFLLIGILSASLLGACGEAKTPEAPALEATAVVPGEVPAAQVPDAVQTPAAPGAVRHITDDTITEYYTIDADVYGPASEEVPQYRAAFLKVTPEQVVEALCPGDTIATKETPADRDYTVAETTGGKHINVGAGHIFFQPANDAHLEWYQMYAYSEFYLAEHPEKKDAEVGFMTAGEAKTLAVKALKDLGVCLEPEFVLCTGLAAGEMKEWQKDFRVRQPERATVGYDADLSGTTEADDCYVMKVSFRHDGLPLLDFLNEPNQGMQSQTHPSTTQCNIILGKEGIRYLECVGLMGTVESMDSSKIISAEQALELFKAKAVNFDGQDREMVVTKVFLEYVPIPDGDAQILRPYWCVVMEDMEYLNNSNNTEWYPSAWHSYSSGARFNAYTGGDLALWE